MTEQLAVLGSPVGHSLSPAIHTAAYAALGLDWEYGRRDCTVDDLETVLRERPWRGLSLTMPLKAAAFIRAAVRDHWAERSGAVNTLIPGTGASGHSPQWHGWNTDIPGLARVITDHELDATTTLVLGTGSTAVSAVRAAQAAGASRVIVTGRRPEAAQHLAATLGAGVCAHASAPGGSDTLGLAALPTGDTPTLTISTLPGTAGSAGSLPNHVTASPLLDVAYDPWPSPLAQTWHERGSRAVPGTEMLLNQAVLQIRIFLTGDVDQPLPDEDRVRERMRTALPDPTAPSAHSGSSRTTQSDVE